MLRVPKGHPLLEGVNGTCKRCPEHMLMYYDATGQPSWQPNTQSLSHGFASATAGHDRLVVMFAATFAGNTSKVLFSSGASATIVS